MAMRHKSEMSPPPAPPSPSDQQRESVIEELRKGSQLAEFLRQQVELIPEDSRRDAALANVSNISTALASSLSVLQSEKEQYCSSSSSYDPGHASGASGSGMRNGPVARSRNRKAKHRRGTYGEELPMKEILTEAPENDRFHWRKYGEKKILHADFPRLYYRCGYSDEHKCPARKYVQQQNSSDQPMFLVTLINDHTCDTLFPADEDHDQPPSSSSSVNNSQVLDFSKASLSSTVGVSRLKEEEDADMSVTVPSYNYTYDELSSSSLPFLSPKQWEMEMDVKSLFLRHSGDGS